MSNIPIIDEVVCCIEDFPLLVKIRKLSKRGPISPMTHEQIIGMPNANNTIGRWFFKVKYQSNYSGSSFAIRYEKFL